MDQKQAAGAFAALSQETRVRLFRLIGEAGSTGMRAGELQARLGVPASTLSFHLSALEQAGLVQSTRRGRMVIYAIRIMGLRDLLTSVTETCCAGQPELCGDISKLFPDPGEGDLTMTPTFNVLFLCTRNSARSIMAETILENVGKGKFHAYSAGSDPASEPDGDVLRFLNYIGHDTSTLRSKSWEEFLTPESPHMDLIIALCDTTTGQKCPEFGDNTVTAAWPLPDPANFTGSDLERKVLLNELYGMIRRRLDIFCNLPFASLDRMALKVRLDELGYPALENA